MSSPNLPPTRRKRPRDKPLTQPHELEGISPRRQVMFVLGLFVGGFVAMWVADVVFICIHLGPHAFFGEGVRFKRIWTLSTGESIGVPLQLMWGVIWTMLFWTWKTVTLAIIETMEEFHHKK